MTVNSGVIETTKFP